jgi:hypothetical protein
MNNINTEYVYFNVYNYTGQQSFESYTLENTPLTFVPNLTSLSSQYSNDQVLWSYGDNTFEKALTGQHVYTEPGIYTVNCWVFDLSGNSYMSTYSTDVTITDYISDRVYFDIDADITLVSGVLNQSIPIVRTNSIRYPGDITINVGSSGGSLSFFEQSLDTNKYGHLLPYSSFYSYVSTNGTEEFVEVESIKTRNNTTLYCIVSNNTIYTCPSSIIGSIVCGTSGFDYVYFKDDIPNSPINLYCHFGIDKINTSTCIISVANVENSDLTQFSVTSTGIDGEGSVSTTYDIDTTTFVNEKIYFVVKIKDSSWYSIKYPQIYTLSSTFSCIIVDSNGNQIPSIIDNNFTILNSLSTGGYFKGSIIPLRETQSARISAFGTVNSILMSGVSNTFTIHPSTGTYSISKKNEDFDWTQTMKDLCFQEVLIDSNVLFDDFIGSIFGGVSSNPADVGKVPYERIANYVDNNHAIDLCNIDKFYSICNAMGYDIQDTRANINYPAAIKRLVDIFSIKYERLVGSTNKFNENFDKRGNYDIEVYGNNLGTELDITTAVLTGGDNFIVAQERFSGDLILCNTFLLSANIEYPLSSYSPDWGWNLVLGTQVSGIDIGKYYTFYTYVSTQPADYIDSIFDYENFLQSDSITHNNWSINGGVIDNMLIYQFLTNTNIISAY